MYICIYVCTYTYMCVYTYVYIYIYIERERYTHIDRERERHVLYCYHVYVCMCIIIIIISSSSSSTIQFLRSGRWLPWLLLGLIVLMVLLVNILNTGIGFIARGLTNHMIGKEKDEASFYKFLAIYGSCFVIALPIRTGQYYFTARLGIMWRAWLSASLIGAL